MTKRKSKAQPVNQMEPGSVNRNLEPHEVALSPAVRSAINVLTWSEFFAGEPDTGKTLSGVLNQIKELKDGDMRRVEAMLYGQAIALDTIFTSLSRRAAQNTGEYMGAADTYLRLALKAQGQCRSNLEALAEMKNPRPVAFVKQANIANGPQQVNNGCAGNDPRAGEILNPSNELSGSGNGVLEDTRAAQAAGRIGAPVEALGTVNRAAQS